MEEKRKGRGSQLARARAWRRARISRATCAASHARCARCGHLARDMSLSHSRCAQRDHLARARWACRGAPRARHAHVVRARWACRTRDARCAHDATPSREGVGFPFPFSSLPFPTCISPTTAIKHQQQPKDSIHHQRHQHNTTTTITKHNNFWFSITHLGFSILVFDFGDLRRF